MKKTAALLAVAGFAAAASANTWIATVTDENGGVVEPGDKLSVNLTIDLDPSVVAMDEVGTQGLSAVILDVVNASSTAGYDINGWTVNPDLTFLTGDLTSSDGTQLFNINAGQLTLFGPFSPADPISIIDISIRVGDDPLGGVIHLDTNTTAFQTWQGTFDTAESIPGEITESEIRITVVPTPASAALLGLGGLVALRRRR